MLVVMLFTPTLIQRRIIFRSNLGQLKRSDGRYLLENVPLEGGENYTIYFEYLPGYSFPFPSFEVQSGSDFQPPVQLFDRRGTPVPNTLKSHVVYGTLSSTATKAAVFRAPSNGGQRLCVEFRGAQPERPSEHEIVVRRSRYSSLPLLILSDFGSNVLILIGIGMWLAWRAFRD